MYKKKFTHNCIMFKNDIFYCCCCCHKKCKKIWIHNYDEPKIGFLNIRNAKIVPILKKVKFISLASGISSACLYSISVYIYNSSRGNRLLSVRMSNTWNYQSDRFRKCSVKTIALWVRKYTIVLTFWTTYTKSDPI